MRGAGLLDCPDRGDTLDSMISRLRSRLFAVAAVVATVATLAVGTPAASAQSCTGVTVSARMTAGSLPGGTWAARDVCVAPEHVYEADVLGYRLVAGMDVATYDGGHVGRLAFAELTVAPGESWVLVGMEDHAADHVTWTLVEGSHENVGDLRRSGGEGRSVTPTAEVVGEEPGDVTLEYRGTPTDLRTAEGPIADELRRLLDEAIEHLTS